MNHSGILKGFSERIEERKKIKNSNPTKDKKTITIEYDDSCSMLSIKHCENSLFYGNQWDFDRTPKNFKNIFKNLGFKVNMIQKDMSNG